MKLKTNSTAQKLRGAYYTPTQLADAVVALFDVKNIHSALEPSCGDGVFLDSMQKSGLLPLADSVVAVEIDAEEAAKVSDNYRDQKNVSVRAVDFFDYYTQNVSQKSFDLILGNPPYIRYQYLSESQRDTLSSILTSHGMKANKLINSWVGFLVACTQMLSADGSIAFIVPAEILQVAYAEDLRLFLSNQFSRITLITFQKLVFPEIEQEVVVFIGEKGGVEKGIRIIEMDDVDDFQALDLHSNGFQKMQHVKEKWTKYFTTADEIELIQALKADKRFCRFGDYGIINIGITTGNNDYFSIDKKTEAQYGLNPALLPLIGRSAHAHGIYFTREDWLNNVAKGKKAQLLVFPDTPYEEYPEGHKEYIRRGEANDEHIGYKCSIRDRWYIVPSVWVPDAFFLRRTNLYPKFVLNCCGAVSTDTMHRMQFYAGVDFERTLLSYYNSVSFAFTEICGRSYGGGVLEILPGEMGNILLPKIGDIPQAQMKELLALIDQTVRSDGDIDLVLDRVDEEILVNHLGIERRVCRQSRAIWKKLQKRRLGRR